MFRFSIRDVLWLTVVVALAVGGWLDAKRLNELVKKAETAGKEERQKAHEAMKIAVYEKEIAVTVAKAAQDAVRKADEAQLKAEDLKRELNQLRERVDQK